MKPFLIALCLFALGLATSAAEKPNPNPPKGSYSDVHRFVFFAVLEGCFQEGLIDEDLDRIIPRHPDNGQRDMMVNFVFTCPLCGPAFDAFCLYAERQRFRSQPKKFTQYDTFGPGLDPELREKLRQPGLACRNAIQNLIQKWIDARIAQLRLNEVETKALRDKLKKLREEGEDALARFQAGKHGDVLAAAYEGWEECPICSGSAPMAGLR